MQLRSLLLLSAVDVACSLDRESRFLSQALGANASDADPRTVHRTDAYTSDAFVRSCAVTMGVRKSGMLPTEQMTKFCQETDAAVECRLQLEGPLEAAHKSGTTAAMESFCKSAFLWFQNKYGAYCPEQCNKLQCIPTCDWLEVKKTLDAEGENLDKESEAVSGIQQRLEASQAALGEAEQDATDAQRDSAHANLTLDRATADLEEKTKYWNEQDKKTEKQQDLVDKLALESETLGANVSAQKITLRRKQFGCDALKQEQDQLRSDEEQLAEKRDKAKEQVVETQKQLEQARTEVAGLEDKVTQQSVPVEEAKKAYATGKENQYTAQGKYESAINQLDTTKAKPGVSAFEIATTEDLVKQMRSRAEAANQTAWDANRTKGRLEQGLGHTKEDLAHAKQQAADLETKVNQREAAKSDIESRQKAKNDELSAKRDDKETCTSASDNMRTMLSVSEATLGQIDRTLDLQRNYLSDEKFKLKKDTTKYNVAVEEQESAKKKITRTMDVLKAANVDLDKIKEQVKSTETAYQQQAGTLIDRIADYKEREVLHNRKKSDIVRKHGLGFIELFGY